MMYRFVFLIILIVDCLSPLTASSQESWILLEEYDSPGGNAQGLYYANKYLWHINGDSLGYSNECMIFKLNPYNLAVIDSFPSPISAPYGITFSDNRWWLTGFGWEVSQLAKMQRDTFLVDTSFLFPNWYFYGVTCDSTNQHLWVSAMNHSYDYYLLEFDAVGDTVVEWHPWTGSWDLGLQYWDGQIWVNTSDWTYPDYTYIYNIDSGTIENMLLCPDAVPEGIATNGVVWWISHLRYGSHYIWKLLPPGATYHDIAAYSPIIPQSGTIPVTPFQPQFNFINYGSVPENNVPFICRVVETLTSEEIYYSQLTYPTEILPEQTVTVTYSLLDNLEPNTDYTFTFYSDMEYDQIRANDTMRVYVHTEGIHDLAILSVLEPDSVEPLTSISPAVVVQNQGEYFESSAPVHLEIEHPNGDLTEDDSQVQNLDINEIDTVYFSPFDPPMEGEYIFIFDGTLPNDAVPSNDFVIVNCTIGLEHDVAPVEVLSPEPVEPYNPITPEVVIANLGDFAEDFFYVYCSIEDSTGLQYNEHVLCQPLGIGEQASVNFPTFNPPYSTYYTFTFITDLGSDNVPENDTLLATSSIGIIHDVTPVEVIWPVETIVQEPFSPVVVIANQGTLPSDGFFTYCRVDSGATLYYLMQSWVDQLNPGEIDTVEFQNILLNENGYCRFLFTTDWLLDDIPENDSLEVWSEVLTGVHSEESNKITTFRIEGGFPNPFNAKTNFILQVPYPSEVRLELFGTQGRKLSSYNYGTLTVGEHLLTIDATDLPSGLYIVKINADRWSALKKVVLVK